MGPVKVIDISKTHKKTDIWHIPCKPCKCRLFGAKQRIMNTKCRRYQHDDQGIALNNLVSWRDERPYFKQSEHCLLNILCGWRNKRSVYLQAIFCVEFKTYLVALTSILAYHLPHHQLIPHHTNTQNIQRTDKSQIEEKY